MRWAAIWNFTLVNVGVLLCGMAYTVPSAIFPNQALSRGISVTKSGLILGTSYIVTFLLTPLCGKLIGKYGAKRIFSFGIMIIGLANIAFGCLTFISDGTIYFWLAISLRIISATGESIAVPASYPLGASQFSKENTGKSMSIIECLWGTGAAVGPAFGGFLNLNGGFATPFWVIGAVFLLTVITIMCCFQDSQSEKDTDMRSTSWKDMILCPGMIAYGIACAFAGVSSVWFMGTMEPHLFTEFGSSSAEIGLVLMMYSLAYTITGPVVGILMDKGLSPLKSVVIGHVIIGITYFTLGPSPGLTESTIFHNIPMKAASLFVQGFGSAFTFIGTLLGMTACTKAGNLPQTDQTTAMVSGLWLITICFGCFGGLSLGSATYDLFGFSWSCLVEGCMILISIPLAIFLVKTLPGRIMVADISNTNFGSKKDQKIDCSIDTISEKLGDNDNDIKESNIEDSNHIKQKLADDLKVKEGTTSNDTEEEKTIS